MALAELTRILGALTPEERSALHVVLITLDPEHDSPARLHEIAAGYGLTAPATRFLTGDPPLVERILDDLRFERRRDPTTGIIEHEAEFLLVDADGRVVGRFANGVQSERQLAATLRTMLAKRRSAPTPTSTGTQTRSTPLDGTWLPRQPPSTSSTWTHQRVW